MYVLKPIVNIIWICQANGNVRFGSVAASQKSSTWAAGIGQKQTLGAAIEAQPLTDFAIGIEQPRV